MLRLLIDENFDQRILRGLKLELPRLGYLVAQTELRGRRDPVLLPKSCSGFLFVPDVILLRLDVQGANSTALELGQDRNVIQVGLGKPLAPQKARGTREQALSNQTLIPIMAQPKGSESVAADNLKKLYGTNSKESNRFELARFLKPLDLSARITLT